MMSRPIAILISDIHFNITTLPLASAALKAALSKAEELQIPLVIAGDLNDTKAIIRAEVANAIISILKDAQTKIYILEGNHDKINEKGSEHGLNYLTPYATVIDTITSFKEFPKIVFIPYLTQSQRISTLIDVWGKTFKILIMHQGFLGAQMGDYIQDKSSLDPTTVKDFTVISGHYHRHQTIGTVTYIGSPYTITFGEANDGPKGFLILNEDGSFTREILTLRKHIIITRGTENAYDPIENYRPGDLLWLKISGPKQELNQIDKRELGQKLLGHSNFKLDLFPIEEKIEKRENLHIQDWEILDLLIDQCLETIEEKQQLKELWRNILNEDCKI